MPFFAIFAVEHPYFLTAMNTNTPHPIRYVPYYRVSTLRQGQSGLGLEGQQREIQQYMAIHPGQVLESFTEIESGKNSRRPQIARAITYAKAHGAILLIAKLDRLARNVHFVSSLLESRVKFKAVDMPEADNFTIHIIAAVAERTARDISEKTRAGLLSKKERLQRGDYLNSKRNPDGSPSVMRPDKHGRYRLGNPQGFTFQMRQSAQTVRCRLALENPHTRMARERIRECLAMNPNLSLAELAEKLNQYNLKTPTGKSFSRYNVQYLKKTLSY
jgi:DNA invertase Pin-like site-specific DNA recombinase